MRLTASIVSGVTCSTSPRISPSKPSRTPMTSIPSRTARIVAAPMTLLMPGAGPPPTRMASFLWCSTCEFYPSNTDARIADGTRGLFTQCFRLSGRRRYGVPPLLQRRAASIAHRADDRARRAAIAARAVAAADRHRGRMAGDRQRLARSDERLVVADRDRRRGLGHRDDARR